MNLLVRTLPIWIGGVVVCCAPKGHHPATNPAAPPISDQAARAPQKGLPEDVRRAQADGLTPEQVIVPKQEPGVDGVAARKSAARLVWATPLGRMFSDYIYAKATPTDNFRKVTAIVDRLFDSIWWSTYRTVAMQLMMEDLFSGGRIDPIIADRVGLLNSNIGLRVRALEVEAARDVRWQLPIFVVAGALGGSKVVRTQGSAVSRVGKGVVRYLGSFGSRTEARTLRRAANDVDLASLLSANVFKNYSGAKTTIATAGVFIAYLPFYYGLRTGAVDSASPLQKTIFYNLTWFINLSYL